MNKQAPNDSNNKISFNYACNTVSAKNQVSFPYYIEGDMAKAKTRVMFIGNSITIHGKKPEIGWNRECGMAASSLERDYVHCVYKELKRRDPSTAILVFNGGGWEMDYTNLEKMDCILQIAQSHSFNTIVLRIGENVPNCQAFQNPDEPYESFFSKLVNKLKTCCDNLIVTDMFWEHPILNESVKKACEQNNLDYVHLSDLGEEDENKAIGLFAHSGVAVHPGDKGMERIAERILKRIK